MTGSGVLIDGRFVRFIAVGLVSALLDVAIVAVLLAVDVSYPAAISLGFSVGVGANYLMHAQVTFGLRTHSVGQFARFIAVVIWNYGLTLLIVWLGHSVCGFDVMASKIASLPIVAVSGFILSKFFVFRTR